jgi:glycerol-3-phosphate O-acyltransferase/dihydroxyacetone phosphate acyltransferase
MLARVITRLVGWVVSVFYDVERNGPELPPGPVLVTANHPNALVDPLVIFRTGGRQSRPLAKAPLFDQALVGTVLKGLGGLPVYRRQDDPALMHMNDRTFDAAVAALHRGEAVQIYPEGQSHSEPSMAPLRTGAARIALQAESAGAWSLGLRVQPVGLTYTRKHRFRGSVLAVFGEPFAVTGWREAYEADPRTAARALTDEIARHLEAITLNFDHPEEAELVEVAERLYSRERRMARPRQRVGLAERLPRLQTFARGVRWLREADPEAFTRLQRSVQRYQRLLTFFGAREGDVPKRYRPAAVAAYAARQLFLLGVVLPLALIGAVVWLVPTLTTRLIAPRFRPELDQVATYKLGVAVIAFPIWLLVMLAAVTLAGSLGWALLSLGVLPSLGLAAVAWKDRQARVREDLRVFLRVLRHPGGRDRLAEQREQLADEFDRLNELWRTSAPPTA